MFKVSHHHSYKECEGMKRGSQMSSIKVAKKSTIITIKKGVKAVDTDDKFEIVILLERTNVLHTRTFFPLGQMNTVHSYLLISSELSLSAFSPSLSLSLFYSLATPTFSFTSFSPFTLPLRSLCSLSSLFESDYD